MSTPWFGRALADARRRKQLSQRQLGHAIGVRQSAITQWERGLVIPRNAHVFAAEQALTLPPGSLACLLGFGPPTARRLPHRSQPWWMPSPPTRTSTTSNDSSSWVCTAASPKRPHHSTGPRGQRDQPDMVGQT